MAERYGRGLYVDAHAAEIRRQEEQLKLSILKKEEKELVKKKKKRLIREGIRQLELEEQKLQKAVTQHEREYEEKKQLDALKSKRMIAEMEKVVAELKEEKSRGDRARKARKIQRKEETAMRDNARKVREMKRREAVANNDIYIQVLSAFNDYSLLFCR